jgi:hypothetical protein
MAQNVMKASEHCQFARALTIVIGPGNGNRLGIWTYCGSIDVSNHRLVGDDYI